MDGWMDGCDESRLGKLSSFSFEEKLTFIVCARTIILRSTMIDGVIFLKIKLSKQQSKIK